MVTDVQVQVGLRWACRNDLRMSSVGVPLVDTRYLLLARLSSGKPGKSLAGRLGPDGARDSCLKYLGRADCSEDASLAR